MFIWCLLLKRFENINTFKMLIKSFHVDWACAAYVRSNVSYLLKDLFIQIF